MKNIKYLIITLAVFAIMLLSTFAIAQNSAATPGPNGIFVWFGRTLPINYQYKLERQLDSGNSNWEEIHRTEVLDLNYSSMAGRLLQAGAKNSVFSMPDSTTINHFIGLLRGKQTSDSIFIFNGQMAYIETMGTGFYDVSAAPEKKYEYRISMVDKMNSVIKSSIVKADPYPGKVVLNKPVFKEYLSTSKNVALYFTLNGKNTPANTRVFKQVLLQTSFKECFPDKFYSRGDDGLMLSIIDSLVLPGVSYRYVVLPIDMLGNMGIPSDTVQINLPERQVSPLEKFVAKPENNFIVLNWRSPKLKNLQSISVYRSDNFDEGFQLLSRVLPTDTSFTDRFITRGISYYYYLVFDGLNESSPPTAKVFAMVDETTKPLLAPGLVKVKQTPEGNLVSWTRTETGTRGYYVYRGDGYTATEYLYSPLIISDSSAVSFLDSIQHLKPGEPYCYAISAINRGNLEGPLSGIAIAEPVKPELPTPVNILAQQYNNKVMLFWDDISGISEYIIAYCVYRNDGEKFIKLAEVSVPTYYDSTVVRGKTYLYAVKAIGIQDSESPLSAAFEFLLPTIKLVPPAGFRLTPTPNSVILNWDAPAVEGLKAYKLYREKVGESRQLVATIDSKKTGYTDSLPTAGNWFYTIITVDIYDQESHFSEELGVKVK